jgi:Holliday junction resolvasome RuvABC DNA-binding subunit
MIYGKDPKKKTQNKALHQIAQSKKTKLQEEKSSKSITLEGIGYKNESEKRVVTNLIRFNLCVFKSVLIIVICG